MAHCINKSHDDFIKLQKETGKKPSILAAEVSVWQEATGMLDRFPTAEELLTPVVDTKDRLSQISELFESNPELANSVYSALGFKIDYSGISIELGRSVERDFGKVQNIIVSYNGKPITSQNGVAGLGEMNVVIKDGEIIVGFIRLPKEYQGKGLTKYIYQAIADNLELPIVNSKLRGYNQSEKGGYIWKNRSSFQPNQITPQQKQQATFMFFEFLDVYLQDFNQVEKILKEEKIIDKKCS